MKWKRGDGREIATEQIERENKGGMINENSYEEGRRERIGWKNNTNDRNMRLGGGSMTAGTFNHRHTNAPVCMRTPVYKSVAHEHKHRCKNRRELIK